MLRDFAWIKNDSRLIYNALCVSISIRLFVVRGSIIIKRTNGHDDERRL